ncbi:hypothetical protein [Cohnella silvisoli]|uniref:Acetoacetate decarboxylase n=1 Tax=Cohnella silvisoli TaxID=2873699 RepID=A0ABV1KT74_9BACL|nr:hypothetical protein [Cohnella silvisoli]MCD9021486.1 hypothetical protein [Cohnella silvisoli]
MNDGEWQRPREILQVDRAIRRMLDLPYRHGTMIQPWFSKKYNANAFEGKAPIELEYSFHMEELPKAPMFLVMERPDQFDASLNGIDLPSSEATEWWVDRCFTKIRIPASFCRLGSNTIVLKTYFHQGIDLESLYLLGEFGVQMDRGIPTITGMPELLSIGSITEQGFPFYGGKLTYILSANQAQEALRRLLSEGEQVRNGEVMLSVPNFEAACVKVRAPNRQEQLIAWQPYEAKLYEAEDRIEAETIHLDVILTRRNTFGPLHQLPLHAKFYAPESFLTEGEHFSKQYVLLPSGLLSAPKLTIKIEG